MGTSLELNVIEEMRYNKDRFELCYVNRCLSLGAGSSWLLLNWTLRPYVTYPYMSRKKLFMGNKYRGYMTLRVCSNLLCLHPGEHIEKRVIRERETESWSMPSRACDCLACSGSTRGPSCILPLGDFSHPSTVGLQVLYLGLSVARGEVMVEKRGWGAGSPSCTAFLHAGIGIPSASVPM